MKYRTTAHSVYNLNFHIVFVTKYRNKVLTGPVEAFLKTQVYHICGTYGWEVMALEVMPDHVTCSYRSLRRFPAPR
jgi:putative transposase